MANGVDNGFMTETTPPLRVLITGASRGLGRALAEYLALERGAQVALVARGEATLDSVVDGIRRRGGIAYGIAADVGDKHAIHRVAGQATDLLGQVDVLVHDASHLGPTPLRLWLDTDCEDLERVLAVNVVGPLRLTKAIAGPMLMRGAGTVVFISSDAAVSAYPRWGAYGASKAAADHLAATLAVELGDAGLRVLSVDPGEMDTQMHADAIPDADRAALARPEAVARIIADMIETPARAPSGRRIATEWERAR